MNSLGIMQGRLSASEAGRFQFFPTEEWSAEFAIAKELGFDHIQWFLDRDIPDFDPIRDIWLDAAILEKIDRAGEIVPISSVDCGRYCMFGTEAAISLEAFRAMFPALSGRLSTGVVSIPLLEDHAPKTAEQKKEALHTIGVLAAIAEPLGVRIALETEMPANELTLFVDSLCMKNVGVCYDLGNTVSYGFNAPAEISALQHRIFEVHLKDRKKGTTQSLLLGTGDADFAACFTALAEIGYTGVYTLQAWRGDDYRADAITQRAFVKRLLANCT